MAKLRLFRVPEICRPGSSLPCSPSSPGWSCHDRNRLPRALALAAGAVLVCAVVTLWRGTCARSSRSWPSRGPPSGVTAVVLAAHLATSAWSSPPPSSWPPRAWSSRPCCGGSCAGTLGAGKPPRWSTCQPRCVAAAVLIVVAYLASGKITALAAWRPRRARPVGRGHRPHRLLRPRRPGARRSPQIVGLLLVDNGIALVAFLLTAGVPLLVELGASLDVLLVVVVLRGAGTSAARPPRPLRPRPAPGAARLMLLCVILAVPLAAGAVTAAVPGRRWAGWSAAAANGAVLVLGHRARRPGHPAVTRPARPGACCGPTRCPPSWSSSSARSPCWPRGSRIRYLALEAGRGTCTSQARHALHASWSRRSWLPCCWRCSLPTSA